MERKYKQYRSMKMHQPSAKEARRRRDDGEGDEREQDVVSRTIGDFGRWQLQLTFLLSLFNIPCTWHIFAPTFHAAPRDFWCARPDNLRDVDYRVWKNFSQPTGECEIYDVDWRRYAPEDVGGAPLPNGTAVVRCDAWEWVQRGDTVVETWRLVCDRRQLNNIAEMMFLTGVAMGGLVSGFISDRCGRKRTLMVSVALQATLGTSIAFAPWLALYFALRIMLGFISVSVVFSGFVLAIELVGGRWRTVSGVSYLFPVPVSYILISGIAWLIPDWRHLQLAISLPGFLFLAMHWVLPESPRWLLTAGRKDDVVAILKDACAVNGRTLPENIDKILQNEIGPESAAANGSPGDEPNPKRVGIPDLFRTKQMRHNTLCLFVIWFAVYMVYYGLVLNMSNIGGDLYINSVLSGIVELPAIAISILFLDKGGRRWPLCLTLVLAGVACLSTIPIHLKYESANDLQWLHTTLAMIGKFSVSSSNVIVPVFTAELFPTVIRNLGVGASNVSAGIALMLVPYLWNLSEMNDNVPMGVLGICGIIGGLCVLILPETADKPLAGTVQQQESVSPHFLSPRASIIAAPTSNNSRGTDSPVDHDVVIT